MSGERTVLIDLDGTLVDSAPDIHAAATRMLHDLGAPPLPFATTKSFIGNGVPTLVRRALAASAVNADEERRAIELFHHHYGTSNGRFSRVFDGVQEGLLALRRQGYRLACVTNKPACASAVLLAATGLTSLLEVVVGGDSTAHMKPHAEPLLHACRLLGTDPSRCVLVGDSTVDVAAAGAARMPVYIVRYGYPGPGGHAAMADAVFIDSLAELPALLTAAEDIAPVRVQPLRQLGFVAETAGPRFRCPEDDQDDPPDQRHQR